MSCLEKNIKHITKNKTNQIYEITRHSTGLKYVGMLENDEYFVDEDENVFEVKSDVDGDSLPNPRKKELFFILGLYGAEEIIKIMEIANENSFFVIIETNPDFFHFALNNKDLHFLANNNVMLIAKPFEDIAAILDSLFRTPVVYLTGNPKFYATYYYRRYEMKDYIRIVKLIAEGIKIKLVNSGNSIEDSLIGMEQTIRNLGHFKRSKDISKLKNKYANSPAIVVAAGPSLQKNINYLKDAQGKVPIIAVDTIVRKLLANDIVPDFVCSVERGRETFDYFYKDLRLPESVTLVAPVVIWPELLDNYQGDIILPMRENVGDSLWLQRMFLLDGNNYIFMGQSCAHVAFGVASHLGASPIILVGQDLAYADDGKQTHSEGTIYDNGENAFEVEQVLIEGYSSPQVLSTKIWNEFRKIYELEISRKGLKVINATEGGAKINFTVQKPLKEVMAEYQYTNNKISELIRNTPQLLLNYDGIARNFINEKKSIEKLLNEAKGYKQILDGIHIRNEADAHELRQCLAEMEKTNTIFTAVHYNMLLLHLIQPAIISAMIELNRLDQVLEARTLQKNLVMIKDFINTAIFVMERAIILVNDGLDEMLKDKEFASNGTKK